MRRLLVPVVAVLALLGCSDSSGDDDGGGATGTGATVADIDGPTETTSGSAGSSEDGPAVDLLVSGAEPHTELRLALVPGTSVTFTSSTSIDQTVNGASPGPITTTFDITAEVLSVDGVVAQVRATYANPQVETDVTAGAEVAAAAEASAAILEGATADLRIDDRGRVVEAEFTPGPAGDDLGPSILDALLDSLTKQGIVLPEDAVGVGAQWVQRTTVDVEGVTTTTEQTYTVTGIDAAGVDLSYTLTATLAGGAEGTTTGTGTVRVSFDSYFTDTDSTAATTMTAQGSEVTQEVTQSVHRP